MLLLPLDHLLYLLTLQWLPFRNLYLRQKAQTSQFDIPTGDSDWTVAWGGIGVWQFVQERGDGNAWGVYLFGGHGSVCTKGREGKDLGGAKAARSIRIRRASRVCMGLVESCPAYFRGCLEAPILREENPLRNLAVPQRPHRQNPLLAGHAKMVPGRRPPPPLPIHAQKEPPITSGSQKRLPRNTPF